MELEIYWIICHLENFKNRSKHDKADGISKNRVACHYFDSLCVVHYDFVISNGIQMLENFVER